MEPATATAAPIPAGRARAFFALGKLRIIELWLGFFVGVSLLDGGVVHDGRALIILALILVAGVAVIAATCSLDDIAGVRDGVDQVTHEGGARWGVDKPILTGDLAERQAFGFVHVLGAIAVSASATAIALAWPLPPWLLIALPAMMLVALAYSYGPKLSYHGAGELALWVGAAGTVLLPYALVTRAASAIVLVEAALVGLWHAQVVVCSNSHDATGDRATGRMTIAARTSARGNRRYVAGVFALSAAVGAVALATGVLPPGYLLALAPVWLVQAYQLWLGVGRGRWLDARRVGFRVVRLGVVALVVANLLLRA